MGKPRPYKLWKLVSVLLIRSNPIVEGEQVYPGPFGTGKQCFSTLSLNRRKRISLSSLLVVNVPSQVVEIFTEFLTGRPAYGT